MSQVATLSGIDELADARTVDLARRIALVAATVEAGLSAGLFYAYQISVIRALAAVDEVAYVTTFRAINEKILNPWFGIMFFGTSPLIGTALVLNRRSPRPVAALIGVGLVLNLALLAITAVGNVPLNDDLAGADVTTREAAVVARSAFERPWNRLNLARTVVAVGSFVSLSTAAIAKSARDRA